MEGAQDLMKLTYILQYYSVQFNHFENGVQNQVNDYCTIVQITLELFYILISWPFDGPLKIYSILINPYLWWHISAITRQMIISTYQIIM